MSDTVPTPNPAPNQPSSGFSAWLVANCVIEDNTVSTLTNALYDDYLVFEQRLGKSHAMSRMGFLLALTHAGVGSFVANGKFYRRDVRIIADTPVSGRGSPQAASERNEPSQMPAGHPQARHQHPQALDRLSQLFDLPPEWPMSLSALLIRLARQRELKLGGFAYHDLLIGVVDHWLADRVAAGEIIIATAKIVEP